MKTAFCPRNVCNFTGRDRAHAANDREGEFGMSVCARSGAAAWIQVGVPIDDQQGPELVLADELRAGRPSPRSCAHGPPD